MPADNLFSLHQILEIPLETRRTRDQNSNSVLDETGTECYKWTVTDGEEEPKRAGKHPGTWGGERVVQGQGQGQVRVEDSGHFIRALGIAFSLLLLLPGSWPASYPSCIGSPKDSGKWGCPDQPTLLHAYLSPACNSRDWGYGAGPARLPSPSSLWTLLACGEQVSCQSHPLGRLPFPRRAEWVHLILGCSRRRLPWPADKKPPSPNSLSSRKAGVLISISLALTPIFWLALHTFSGSYWNLWSIRMGE